MLGYYYSYVDFKRLYNIIYNICTILHNGDEIIIKIRERIYHTLKKIYTGINCQRVERIRLREVAIKGDNQNKEIHFLIYLFFECSWIFQSHVWLTQAE